MNSITMMLAFRGAFADMDSQYRQIREARRELFKWDVSGNTGSNIVVDFPEADFIEWD